MNQELRIRIAGRVVRGDHYGKKLGFPTANLDRRDYLRRKLKIKFGVWAGIAEIVSTSPAPRTHSGHPPHRLGRENRKFYAGIVIGPYDKHHLPRIEAHLIGFKGNLYDKYLNIYLNKYLRPFRKFRSAKQLKRQISKDIQRIKRLIKIK